VSRQPSLGAHAALRWPLAPLLELARMTPTRFARVHGISGAVMRRAGAEGLNDRHADHWATRAGYHPAEVWGWAWATAGHLGTDIDQQRPARPPAPTRRRRPPRRSTGHTAPRTPVPISLASKAIAS
jgi:hypothetical protein